VEWGNLLALPVGDGILYLEPMYLRRQAGGQGEALPVLTNVAISYGGYVGFAPTFEEALNMVVMKTISGATPEAEQSEGETDGETPTETPSETPSETPTEAPTADPPEVEAAITKVLEAQAAYEEAQASGSNEQEGAALDALLAALDELQAAREAAGQ
jgi:uncharacterized membrane protein (UPF0182 family)